MRRTKIALVVGALAALLLVLLLRGGGSAAKTGATVAPAATAAGSFGDVPPLLRVSAPPQSPAAADPDPAAAPPPVIDEITVEKAETCEGEPNVVTVRAHGEDGTDAYLRTVIAGHAGTSAAVERWIPDEDDPAAEPKVMVFGKDGVSTTAPVPAWKVLPCKPARVAYVVPHLRANTDSEFDLAVTIKDVAPPLHEAPFAPNAYRWTFGDGATATTGVPLAVHAFTPGQGRRFSTWLVKVEILAPGHPPLTAAAPVELLDAGFESEQLKGMVLLQRELTPRFPDRRPSGEIAQGVRVFHHRKGPVRITEITRTTYFADGSEPRRETLPPTALGTDVVPPGHGLDLPMTIAAGDAATVYQVTYDLRGVADDGMPAMGGFSVMVPPAPPTAEHNVPVDDDGLKARILAARKLLGKPFVTEEDLLTLEREGKFKDLPPWGK